MKKRIVILLCIAFLLSGCISSSILNPSTPEFQAYFTPLAPEDVACEGDVYFASSQVLLTATSNASYQDIETLITQRSGEIIGYISDTGDYQIRFTSAKSYEALEQLVSELKYEELVEDASLAYAAQISSSASDYSNDPWIDANTPSDTSGSVWDEEHPSGNNWWAEAIGMPSVWSMDLNTQTVKVGIIDSMFDTENDDLDENLFAKTWNNPVNEDGSCNVTQLYNSAIGAREQLLSGEDKKAIQDADKVISNISHGTHVAGIIAAQADNGFGITGINQNVQLYGYTLYSDEARASEEAQWGSIFQFKCAIAHLLNEGVKVINISMGFNAALTGTQDGDPYWTTFTSVNSKSMETFLQKYIDTGHEFLIVKAAGNDSRKEEHDRKVYDASYDVFGAISSKTVSDRIIMVGAARYNTKYGYFPIADFSNTGPRIDVYAPGVDILSDIPSNAAALKSGTSMSAPIVSGLASLIWGINPELSAEQVKSFIQASTCATIFNLDDEPFFIRDLINWAADPTAIVNANICVQLAMATTGTGSTPDAQYGTLSGMIYARSSDGTAFEDVYIESLSVYDEGGNLVSTLPVQDIAYHLTDESTGEVSVIILHAYSSPVKPGTYTLKVEAEGYESQQQRITVQANDVIKTDFAFSSPPSPAADTYNRVLDMFYKNIKSNWTELDYSGGSNVFDPDSVSYLFWQYSDYSLADVGYAFVDLDGNGQSELLVSPFDVAEFGMIYDLYTVSNGEILHLLSSGERDQHFLTTDHTIHNSGSGGAASSSNIIYRLDSSEGKLKVQQAVIYDAWQDSENPWFYATTEYYDAQTYKTNFDVMTHITQAEALSLLDNFPDNIPLELTPFDKYIPSEEREDSTAVGSDRVQSYQRDADIYTQYLLSGGYNDISLCTNVTPEDYEISTCLVDLNEDNVFELFISLVDKSEMNWRGYPQTQALLTIRDGKVENLVSAGNWGGSGGGDDLSLEYDSVSDSYVIIKSCFYRDGVDYSQSVQYVFSAETGFLEPSVEFTQVRIYSDPYFDGYAAIMENVKSSTSLYTLEDGTFLYYTIDGRYVDQSTYQKMVNRFTTPEDSEFSLTKTSYNNPIA